MQYGLLSLLVFITEKRVIPNAFPNTLIEVELFFDLSSPKSKS